MKRSILVLSMVSLLMAGSVKTAVSQEQPKPKKDTVNIDTDAKPTFYYADEEAAKSKSGIPVVAIIAGVAVVVAVGAFFILKKKKG
jgi:cobalamin biosynthesis Mg chelatase CobN